MQLSGTNGPNLELKDGLVKCGIYSYEYIYLIAVKVKNDGINTKIMDLNYAGFRIDLFVFCI